ncbi:MAG: electron transfer flavoprotein subunit alpha [Bacteroidetes bacterium HGW-Bacteroidetes-21]|jgi:electron transfer flavoprotein alpha subunit|nr:MAG: electron transfer flavoprotein subunit alpha [Bacteroidetes bacterium HGW-Bacteroidetes-21]
MNTNEYKDILVFAEVQNLKPAENSLELLGEANRLRNELGDNTRVLAAVLGSNISPVVESLFRFGADVVISFVDDKLAEYRSDLYGEALTRIIEKYKPAIVLIGATFTGSELAPTVAAKLKTGLAAHCTELKINDEGNMVQVVPAFGGKVLGDILTPNHRPQMATVKAGITQKIESRDFTGTIEDFQCDLTGFGDRIKITGRQTELAKGKPLHESECIIGGGFGIGNKENWTLLEELATLLNGATGCTRPALDEGWSQDEHAMIGTSGVAVRPKIYINAGISGAAHHTCGIKDAGVIISINKDANAPIFEVSDYKIVSDWKKIVEAVVTKLK